MPSSLGFYIRAANSLAAGEAPHTHPDTPCSLPALCSPPSPGASCGRPRALRGAGGHSPAPSPSLSPQGFAPFVTCLVASRVSREGFQCIWQSWMWVPVAGLVWGRIWGFDEFLSSGGGAGSQWARPRLESNHLGLLKAEGSSWDPGGGGNRPKSPWHEQAGDPRWVRPRGPARWWEGSSWPQNALPSSGAELGGAQLLKNASLVAESLLSIGNEIRGVMPIGRGLRSTLPQGTLKPLGCWAARRELEGARAPPASQEGSAPSLLVFFRWKSRF